MSDDIWSESTVDPAQDVAEEKAGRDVAPLILRPTGSAMVAGIFVLLLLCALYFTGEIVVPLIFALLLKLLLQPGVRLLGRSHVPPPVAALVMILLLFGVLGAAGYALSGPAASWMEKAPQSLPRLRQQLSPIARPIQQFEEATTQIEKITEGPNLGPAEVVVKGPGLAHFLFSGTRSILTGLGITVLMVFFLLASDDAFMRRLVEILPSFRDKKQAVAISREVEENLSAYLATITGMNLLVGFATACAMWAIGLPDPALWGALAFVLNYVLILGPLAALCLFFLIGLMTFDTLWQAALPPAAFLAIHIVEGQWATPTLVARRFTINPVLVVGSLIFWNWMWGIPGALLAVPMLAVFKIVCDRVRPLAAIGHFIGD
jgi:predicted PurR-regulated permease PerM